MDNKKIVAVFFGGRSPEHEVSVITGIQVLNNMDREKFVPIPVYVAKDGKWYTSDSFFDAKTFKDLESVPYYSDEIILEPIYKNNKLTIKTKTLLGIFGKKDQIPIDIIFPCFHGGLGESGSFQGLFEIVDLPYVGCNVMGSALGMDKVLMKKVFEANNIPVVKYLWFYKKKWQIAKSTIVDKVQSTLKYPLFVKPANAGSSIGIAKVNNKTELENAIDVAVCFDTKFIVEESFEQAKEINISLIGSPNTDIQVSVCEEVFAAGQFLNYDDKYKSESGKSSGMASTTRTIPANISSEIKQHIEDVAKNVFILFGCSGLVRLDFLVNEISKEIKAIEINTIPGSMCFYLWEPVGLDFTNMISRLIEIAQIEKESKADLTTTFNSNILQTFPDGLKNKLGKST